MHKVLPILQKRFSVFICRKLTAGGEQMNAQRIGEKLKALRSNQTLKEVSGILGISDSALNAYELGLRVPRDDVKIKLAKYYGQSIESLFYEDF